MGRPTIDMAGKRIGKLTVLERVGAWDKQVWWLCRCECGTEKVISGATLRRGKTQSCGCVYRATRSEIAHKSIAVIKHGDSFSRLYFMYRSMRARCENPNSISYKSYGGRGINVCEEWLEYANFKKWALESGYDESAPLGECTIDRIDADGNYCPENCRWVTAKDQANNRRSTPFLTINGETLPLTEWAEKTGIPRDLIYSRYKRGWSGEELISAPEQHRRRICVSHSTKECQQQSKQSTD